MPLWANIRDFRTKKILQFQVNLGGAINVNLTAKDTVEKGNGVVVNLTGLFGLEHFSPSPFFSSFASGVVNFTRGIGHDNNFKRFGVRFAALCTGVTKTNFTVDLEKRMYTREMGKDVVEFLEGACKQSSEACAKAVVEVIKYGPSGSVWVVEGSRLFYYDAPDYREHMTLVSQFV